ncbi:replication initiation protein [Staphylococcus warneri]|uniref:Replication initiation protein n=1 Tax=Staphylococcus warneri TaxID=1292 RepID=A0A8B2ZKE0_STAWA|nr:replication initiation protein [Staphylococcus warneri]RGM28293.1 replication initiation protein [Staphylococcus warneri]
MSDQSDNIIKDMQKCGYSIMRHLKKRDIDLFLYLCYVASYMIDENVVSLSYAELKKETHYPYSASDPTYTAFIQKVIQQMDKDFIVNHKDVHILNLYYIDGENALLHLSYNPYGLNVLKSIGLSISELNINQCSKLKSVYSKRLYKMLLDTEEERRLILSVANLRYWLHIPNTYTVKDINEKILKYVAEDIRNIESRFKIYKIVDGRKITHYEFEF